MRHDAIVVGARCAGSSAAMLLARKGYRVLLLDKATFPSDTLSGHFIRAPGVARLKRWGLLDCVVKSNAPRPDHHRRLRPRLGFGGRRRVSSGSHHRARHDRRVP